MSPGYNGKKLMCALAFLSMSLLQASFAQGVGTIKGVVFDKTSKDRLPGANIVVKGTSVGTTTNLNGEYVIRNAPTGSQTVLVSYIGYTSISVVVNIPDGVNVNQDFALAPTTIQGAEVVVTGQAQGQLQAINQQLASDKIASIVSEAKIQELPDFNAAQAISRLPGVSTIESSGEASKVVIRGLAPQFNEVAVSGIPLASTGNTEIGTASQGGTSGAVSQDRSVDLTMVTPYMIKSIEVYKTLTPDMNANAVGGYVNMELREAPSGTRGDLLWQSGYTSKSNTYGNYRGVASGSTRLFDDHLGVYVLGNLEQYDRNSDNMSGQYTLTADTIGPNGYDPVKVTTVGLNRHLETRKRYGGNAIIDYQLPAGSIRSINMVSRLTSDYTDYDENYDYLNHNLGFTYRTGTNKTDLAVNTLEFTNDFGPMSAELKVANTYSRNYQPNSPFYQFQQTGTVGVGGVPDNTIPQQLLGTVAYAGPGQTYLNSVTLFSADYKENDQVYRADFKVPLTFESSASGFIKFGGDFRYNLHNNTQATPYAAIDQTSPIQQRMVDSLLARFPVALSGATGRFSATNFTSTDQKLFSSFLDNKFGSMLWVPDPTVLNQMTQYIAGNPAFSGTNVGGWFDGPYQHLPNDYKYIEKYYAAYAMAEMDFGPDIKVVGGARFEEDRSLYAAFNLVDGRDPRTQTWIPVTVYPENHYWLPMAQAKYTVNDWADVRYAYTQTLARPDYTQLSPHFVMDYTNTNVWAGNPNLVPGQAYNHDLIFTIHSNEVGLLSLGGFYKTISHFTYYTQYKLHTSALPGLDSVGSFTPAPKNGATLYTYINSPYDAYVKGLEIDFQTRFWYLPAPLDGIVFGINYTHIWSKATYPWRDDRTYFIIGPPRKTYSLVVDSTWTGRLINQPDDILNAYVGYDYGGFSARLSFLFQGNSVSSVLAFPEQGGYTNDYFRIDAAARQKLPWANLELYLDATNLNSRINSAAQQSIGGFTQQLNYGLTADLGIRFTM